MSDVVERLRNWNHGIPKTMIVSEAIDEIERLRKGIQDYLDGNFGPDFASKHDKCPHDLFGWEVCGNCIDQHFAAVLNPTPPSPIEIAGSEKP